MNKQKIKTYHVGVLWSVWAGVLIKANSEEEAQKKASEMTLPIEAGEYIDESFRVDYDDIYEIP